MTINHQTNVLICRTISISRPDLKVLAESLLYKNRLFTITEQEDCRETAQNLVDFIQYLRLIVSLLFRTEFSFENQLI
jgi:hypothetical protein